MNGFKRKHHRGATQLEFALALGFIGVCAWVLLKCIITYRAEAEQVAAKQLIGSLRTALAVRSSKAQSSGGIQGLIALSHQNPMTWLQRLPENYLGEYYSPNENELPSGNWYFDPAKKTLVYLPAVEKSFSTGTQKVLIFKVEFIRVSGPVNASGQIKGTTGLVIEQLSAVPQ